MFKSLIPAIVIASALAVPTFAFAQQSNAPLTRADVKSQLAQLEKAGYNPSSDEVNYPASIQAAEARVAAQNNTAYGAPSNGTSVSGARSDDTSTTPAR
jgi:Domain of unknown function (DUF4148)